MFDTGNPLSILTPRQRTACVLRLGPGTSVVPLRSVATAMGVTRAGAAQLIRRGLDRLDRGGVPTDRLRLRIYPSSADPEPRRCAA